MTSSIIGRELRSQGGQSVKDAHKFWPLFLATSKRKIEEPQDRPTFCVRGAGIIFSYTHAFCFFSAGTKLVVTSTTVKMVNITDKIKESVAGDDEKRSNANVH